MPQLHRQCVYYTCSFGRDFLPMDLAHGSYGQFNHEQHHAQLQLDLYHEYFECSCSGSMRHQCKLQSCGVWQYRSSNGTFEH
jgi:hypothetical protein